MTDISNAIKQRIEAGINNAQATVEQGGDRHYAISVISSSFANLSTVKQHQLVYATITDLMSGNDAPIHAIDRMNLQTP